MTDYTGSRRVTKKHPKTGEITVDYILKVYLLNGRWAADMIDMMESPDEPESLEASNDEPKVRKGTIGGPELFGGSMSKGEFRLAIRAAVVKENVHGNGGVDVDKVDEALQRSLRWMRANIGGLIYNNDNVVVALEIYKKIGTESK